MKNIFLKTELPLAGNFLSKDKIGTDTSYPFSLSFDDETLLVEVVEKIDPNIIFKNYFYKTGSIKTLSNHLKNTAKIIKNRDVPLKICDIGCNDFTFLKEFTDSSETVLGVDPSDVSKKFKPDNIDLVNDFFNYDQSKKIKEKYGEFDIIFSSNNFAHINEIDDYANGVANLIKDDGKIVIEVHWLKTLIKNFQIGFLYHEHVYYYSLKALNNLLSKSGLYVNSVDKIDIHGGSIRVFCSKQNYQDESVDSMFKEEADFGLYSLDVFKKFFKKIEKLKKETRSFFESIKKGDKKVYGYGASGQANTLMTLMGINSEDLEYIIDDSPLKSEKFTPNNYIQIRNGNFFIENPPDVVYIMAYTFQKEIKQNNKWFKGEWVHPFNLHNASK